MPSADPRAADANPYTGDSVQPASNTIQSPRLRYPLSGDGMIISEVAIYTSAAKSAAPTIFFVLEYIFTFSPFTFFAL